MRKVLISAALAAVAVAVLPVASAQAGLLATTTDCELRDISQPFMPWGDSYDYILRARRSRRERRRRVDAGGRRPDRHRQFALLLQRPDRLAFGLDPEGRHGDDGNDSCIGKEHPTLRFFAKNDSSGITSMLEVRVVVETSWGREFCSPSASSAAT